MRNGWRGLWVIGLIALLAISRPPARGFARDEDSPIHLTVEIAWGDPNLPILPRIGQHEPRVELRIEGGRILQAQGMPERPAPVETPDESWLLGSGESGRVRVRLETAIGGSLFVRAGDSTTRFPILNVIEGPQQGVVHKPVPIEVSRLPWDSLEVGLAEGDGAATPGATVPITLGFNVLTPKAGQVVAHFRADLRESRGTEIVWSTARDEVIATNCGQVPTTSIDVPMPEVEGTYVLEIRSHCESLAGSDGSVLGRWLKRRRNTVPAESVRRVSLAVVGRAKQQERPAIPKESSVDLVDLAHIRGGRTSETGRARLQDAVETSWIVPNSALGDASRRERIRGLIGRGGLDGGELGPIDASGIAWSALSLKVSRPGRPHRLVVTMKSGMVANLGVALIAPGGRVRRPRVLLDSGGAAAIAAAGGGSASASWLVWPDAAEPTLVLSNHSPNEAIRVGTVELRELSDQPAPAVLAETQPNAPRSLALLIPGERGLDLFGGVVDGMPDDVFERARNLASYAAHCGASHVVLPEPRPDRSRRLALDGQAAEDSLGPDATDLTLRILNRHGISVYLGTSFNGVLPGLPAPDSPEAFARGVARIDSAGRSDGFAYQPLHPETRAAMRRRVVDAIGLCKNHPNVAGLQIRLGPGSTLPGGPESGLDDVTYDRFVSAMFQPDVAAKVPGRAAGIAEHIAERVQFVSGPGRKPWLDWRAQQLAELYADLARAVRSVEPGAALLVATPGLDAGPAGLEARKADRADQPKLHAWKAVGLDFDHWHADVPGLVVLRSMGTARDPLTRELAMCDELDAPVAARPSRGVLIADQCDSEPASALQLRGGTSGWAHYWDEPLSHSLAALDAHVVVVGTSLVGGNVDRLTRFAQVLRGLPAQPENATATSRSDTGVAARTWSTDDKTYLSLANDTPYRLVVENVVRAAPSATIEDLARRSTLNPAASARGGKSLVVELAPFDTAAIRINAPGATVETVPPYLPGLADLDAQVEQLSARLDRLARNRTLGVATGPPNPSCEPIREAPDAPKGAFGWAIEGGENGSIEIDATQPHSGRGSLKFTARTLPAAAVTDAFQAAASPALTLQVWLRADRPNTKVRIQIEGEASQSDEPSFRRSAEWTARAEWTQLSVRAANLPTSGPSKIRVRFECVQPKATLWIDDLSVAPESTEQTVESTRRANRVLLAALQAYREKKYADFARLAGSFWDRFGRGEPPDDSAGALRTGQATDLPQARRIR